MSVVTVSLATVDETNSVVLRGGYVESRSLYGWPVDRPRSRPSLKESPAFRFVVLVGVMSLFADFVYEGSRSIIGSYLGLLGAGALAISFVTGLGEFLGYALRLVSGRSADRTGLYWPITFGGYVLQMVAVPALALAGSWQIAAVLIVAERVGKATRNPPRDAMLSHAATEMGYGWGFGLHEALDQFGAMLGPLLMALLLAIHHNDYKLAFAALAVPAAIMLSLLVVARIVYPRPHELEATAPSGIAADTGSYPRVFWIYLAGAALVGAGFADFPLIAFHFQRSHTVEPALIPVFYAAAMAVGGTGSYVFGRIFDRLGIGILLPLTIVAAVYAPLAFLGGFWVSLVGVSLWGLGMAVQESIIPAAVAPMVSSSRRASAYGLFTGAYGISWFLGSVAIGALYYVSLDALVAFSIVVQLAALPLILIVRRRTGPQPKQPKGE
jgi:predicted MFS family arabinose efflux permease